MDRLPFPVFCPLYAEMETAVAVVRTAASLVMRHYGQLAAVDYKAGQEPVTVADRACNEYITARLREAYPHDAVLSEEDVDDLRRLERDRVWIVDPLDGTKEFIDGLDQFAIMIGLAVRGEPRLGVVLQPATGQLWLGIVDEGAYVCHAGQVRRLQLSARMLPQQLRVAVSRSHLTPLMEKILAALNVDQRIRMGSVGLKVGLLVTHQAVGYFHASRGLKEWDLCGPAAVLLAAGGKFTDCWGRTIRFNQRDFHITHGLVATDGLRHTAWVNKIRAACEAQGYTAETGFAPR